MPSVLRAASGSVVLMILLTACSMSPERTCTQIGSSSGIGVTVQRDLAPTLSDLSLTVCRDGNCIDHTVSLTQGTTTSSTPCPTGDPEETCSATPTPDGTSVGFVELPDLAPGQITISATAKLGANALTLAAADVTVKQTFPNGDACPPGGNQARISLSSTGISPS